MSAALHSYRAFLRVVAAMPKQQRGAAVQQARSELAFFRDVSDPAEAARLVDAEPARAAVRRRRGGGVRRPGARGAGRRRAAADGAGLDRRRGR